MAGMRRRTGQSKPGVSAVNSDRFGPPVLRIPIHVVVPLAKSMSPSTMLPWAVCPVRPSSSRVLPASINADHSTTLPLGIIRSLNANRATGTSLTVNVTVPVAVSLVPSAAFVPVPVAVTTYDRVTL